MEFLINFCALCLIQELLHLLIRDRELGQSLGHCFHACKLAILVQEIQHYLSTWTGG